MIINTNKFKKLLGIGLTITGFMSLIGCSEQNPVTSNEPNGDDTYTAIINGDDIRENTYFDGNKLNKSSAAFSQVNKWHFMNILRPNQNGELRWFLETNCNDGFDAKVTVRNAFAQWQKYVPFRFVEASSAAEANTVIRFVNSDTYVDQDGVTQQFFSREGSGIGTIFGLGWRPHEAVRGLGFDYWGDIMINDRARWANNNATSTVVVTPWGNLTYSTNLFYTLTHEIGHTLGFAHDNSNTNNLMHTNAGFTANARLWDADIQTAFLLYQMAYDGAFGPEHVTALINGIYNRFLGRNSDQGGLDHFRNLLTYNRLPSKLASINYEYRDCMVDAAASDEAWSRSGQNINTWITNMYYWFHNRQPDPQGLTNWVNAYRSGQTRRQIATAFAYCQEWNQNYVSGLYRLHLNRNADQGGLNYYTGMLNRREITPQELEVIFTTSPEYYSLANPQNNNGYLTRVYQTLLGRQPDQSGLQYWLGWID